MKDELQTREVFRYVSENPGCAFDRIVLGTGYARGVVKDVCKELMNAGVLDAGLRARGIYKVTGPLPVSDGSEPDLSTTSGVMVLPDTVPRLGRRKKAKGSIQTATDPASVPYQRLVHYVKRLNAAYEKLRAKCAVKASRIAELERMVQSTPDVESLIVHKELMEP